MTLQKDQSLRLAGPLVILGLAAAVSLATRAVAQPEIQTDIITGSSPSDYKNIRRVRVYPGSHLSSARSSSGGREPFIYTRDFKKLLLDYNSGTRDSILDGGPERAGVIAKPGSNSRYVLSLDRSDTGREPAIIEVNEREATAHLLRDIYEGSSGSETSQFTSILEARGVFREAPRGGAPEAPSRPHNGVPGVYFDADNGVIGNELWFTNGVPGLAGTHVVKDIHTGAGDSDPLFLTAWEGILYFAAQDSGTNRELWRSDGTEAGTVLVKEIRPGGEGSELLALTLANGKLWFTANDGNVGSELWMSDGTTAGTVLVADLVPGPFGSIPIGFTAVGDRVLFVAFHPFFGLEPYVTDGTDAGTDFLVNTPVGPYPTFPRNLTTVGEGDLVVFWADEFASGTEPWITDGTAQGTRLLMDINSGAGGSAPPSGGPFLPVGTRHVIFTADDGVHGPEPWVLDLTTGDVRMLADIYPGAMGSDPSSYALFQGMVLFDADDGQIGREPWIWDPGATSQPFGLPCTGGFPVPTMEATDPVVGKTMRFSGENAPVGSLGAIVFGEPTLQPAPLGAPCFVAIDIALPTLTLGIFRVTQSEWSSALSLPSDPSLVGVLGGAQTVFLSPSTSWGYELTNASLLRLGN